MINLSNGEIDKAIRELDPEIQKLLGKKAYEQWLRILSIVREGREFFYSTI